jgi:tRNA1Val (adenine37-N6)-methyltransferase
MFRFKQFNVDQTGCAMKINTDGVLLGALTQANEPANILDIGTGTGVIALMLAQRFTNAKIDAIEIDEPAAQTAKLNFENSPYSNRVHACAMSFSEFFERHPEKKYDLIVSNPPFYINSLESPGAKKSLAKHADESFFENLLQNASRHLNDSGTFWLILPLQTAELVNIIAYQYNLNRQKKISVLSYPDSIPHREILVLTLDETLETDEQFVIYEHPKVYSQQYQNALKSFFTIF